MMKHEHIAVQDIIRQDGGLHTIVFNNGDRQENAGICLHAEMLEGDGTRYYWIAFEVVSVFNPIIKDDKDDERSRKDKMQLL